MNNTASCLVTVDGYLFNAAAYAVNVDFAKIWALAIDAEIAGNVSAFEEAFKDIGSLCKSRNFNFSEQHDRMIGGLLEMIFDKRLKARAKVS